MASDFFSSTEKNEQVKDELEKRLGKYGEISYAFAVINKRNFDDILIITNLPSGFIDSYLESKYQNIDPVLVHALNRVSPIIWDDTLRINSQWAVTKIFESVRPKYDIVSGHTFVLHDQNNNLIVLSLYINKFLMAEIDENVKKHKYDLQGVLIETHEILLHLYRDENQQNINESNILSARENEILYWSSTGKTYPEIARMLDITVSTVKFHMGKIVKKLGVNNAKHAISLAIELNIISHPSGR